MNRRYIGPVLSVLLIIGVGAALFFSVRERLGALRTVTVNGLTGSEKEEFLQDERVLTALRRHGLDLTFEKAGSRQIATSFDLSQYDYTFPAGVPSAEKIRREQGVSRSYEPFFTPMAVASWRPIADTLVANGLATKQGNYYTLDMAKLLDLINQGTRWSDLADNPDYAVNKRILITSTDIRRSNSAAMYLALMSYVANGNQIVQSEAQAWALLPQLSAIFLEQGFTEYSSEAPFEDYLVMGMGKAPLVMIYEAQFISYTAATDGNITADMVLMYPEPTIFTKHTLVPLTDNGARLGEALETDAELQRLAVDFGFRSNDTAYFREFVEQNNLPVPPSLINVIEPPSYEVLESMIVEIEKLYGN